MRSTTDPRDGRARRGTAARRRVGELLSAAVELDTDEDRRAFLAAECGDDHELLREVLSLLDAHGRSGPLDRLGPALDEAVAAVGSAEPASPDDHVGHYRVLGRIGGGGMGVVYRAHDQRLDRAVALKFLSPALLADGEWRARFLAEARAAAALEHPNLCTIHEIRESDDGRLFIAMPLYAGRPLDAELDRGALPPDRAVDYAIQTCRGLGRAHDHGIVHRDVKPANLLVTDDGIVKILDFGVATIAGGAGPGRDRSGRPPGTAAYMSPEQVRGEPADHRADIWALGVVLYEMLTGRRPFRGESWPELRDAILEAEPDPVVDRRPGLPPAIDRVLTRTLAKDAADRYESTRELARALEAVRGRMASADPSPAAGRAASVDPDGADAASATVALGAAGGIDSGAREEPGNGPRSAESRPATVLVTTLTGFAGLRARSSAERVERLTRRLHRAAEATVARHGARIERCGDGVIVAVFGVPAAREDDCLRAVRAAHDLRDRLSTVAAELGDGAASRLRVRSGVCTGRVVARPAAPGGSAATAVSGTVLRAARRLAGIAPPGGVLLGPATRRLAAPFFRTRPGTPLALEPGGEPLTPWLADGETGVRTRLEAEAGRGLTPFVGRRAELELLDAAVARARDAGEGRFVSVRGEAGAGKSRLLHECERRLGDDVRVVHGRCRAYGGRAAYRPFREALRELLGLTEGDPAAEQATRAVAALRRIAPELHDVVPLCLHLLSIPSEAHRLPGHLRGEHFRAAMLDALGAVFTLSARRRPLVLLLEDWHEADHASIQVLERLLELLPAYAVVVAATYRPGHGVDFGDPPSHTPIRLGPLDADAADEITRWVLDADSIQPRLGRALRGRAGGNPFFLEELCRALREGGEVTVEGGRVRTGAALDRIGLPDTVQGVIRTRLDRIDPDAREVLRIASVVGREFDVGVLARVLGAGVGDARLDARLERLAALGLVHAVRVLPARAYRFQHALTRDVAYESLLEPGRRRLHGLVGRAIEAVHGDRRSEFLDDLAHHFAQAGEWSRAADHARDAAERAAELSEFEHAIGMLGRARHWLARLPATDELHARITDVLFRQERLCETLGLRDRQQRIIDELFQRLGETEDRALLADAHLRQGDLHTLDRRFGDAARSLARALRLSRALADRERERNTRRSIGLLRWHQGRDAAAVKELERALVIDRQREDAEAIAGDLANLGNVLRNRGEIERALRCLEEALAFAERSGNVVKQAYTLQAIGNVHRALGDDDEALRYYETACERTAEHRLAIPYSFHLSAIAHIRLRRGEIDESLDAYREAVAIARRAKHADGLSHALRILGDVLFGLGRRDEALPLLEEAATLFGRLRNREGELLARARIGAVRKAMGDTDAALDAYRVAAALARTLDRPDREATLRNTLGILEWERGEYGAAFAEYERALALFERVGDRVGAGLVLNSLGVTLSSLGRHTDAVDRLRHAVELNHASGQRRWEAHGLAALADAHVALGDRRAARACYERSLAIRREIGDRAGEQRMLHDLERLAHGDRGERGERARE